jgi:hypothetical protein
MTQAWIALIGTVFGGAGFKILEHLLGQRKNRDDIATNLRAELRAELLEERRGRDQAEAEADRWRTKYYSLVSSVAAGNLKEAQRKIQRE